MGVDLNLSGPQDNRSMRLCTNQGFDLVAAWGMTVPADRYPAVAKFFRDYEFEPSSELAEQLNDAANMMGPTDPITAETLSLLLDRIGLGYPDEHLSITF